MTPRLSPGFLGIAALLASCGTTRATTATTAEPPAVSQAEPTLPGLDSYPIATRRLARLARVWGTAEFLHPYLPTRALDWDAAGMQAIADVARARDDRAFADAVSAMLATLGDPATLVAADEPATGASYVPVTHRRLDGGALLVDLGSANTMRSFQTAMSTLPGEIAGAKAVIFDLRAAAADHWLAWIFEDLNPLLADVPLELPVLRARVHSGYRPQNGSTSGGYYSALETTVAELVQPADGTAAPRTVFLVGSNSALPPIAVSLQARGRAAIVATSPTIDDRALGITSRVALGEGWHAEVRTAEALYRGQPIRPTPDIVANHEGAVAAAMGWLDSEPRARAVAPSDTTRASPIWEPDQVYADVELTREHRVLAAFRLWNVIAWFYPYRDLIGDWDAVLPLAITELAAAESTDDYTRAVVRIAMHITDTHTGVRGGRVAALFPRTSPVGAEMIEGRVMILHPGDEAKRAGVERGDIVESIDGVPIAAVFDRVRPYVTASTPGALDQRLIWAALGGVEGTSVRLGLDGPTGRREVTVVRTAPSATDETDDEPPFREIEPGIGYVDLRVLTPSQVDAMFTALKDTHSIIFDMRGYPKGTAWSIAPRLNAKPGVTYGATFSRQLVSGLASHEESRPRIQFRQPLPDRTGPPYRGKTYMLIDASTISQAEHTGLFFEAANGTQFIGTNTSGANGDVTSLCLPGGLCVYFTGHDVRHADGRQLQRVGLVPDLRVAPTIEGVRAGKDEILDAARELARTNHTAP